MNDVVRIVLFWLVGNVFLVAFMLAMGAFFPKRLAQTGRVAEAMPGRAFLAGLVNVLFFGALALAFGALADWIGNELPRVPALIFFGLLIIGASFGLAGVVPLVGARLLPERGPLAHTAWGTLILSLACTLPLVGWFALLPYAVCLGLGGFIIGFFYRRPAELVEPSTE